MIGMELISEKDTRMHPPSRNSSSIRIVRITFVFSYTIFDQVYFQVFFIADDSHMVYAGKDYIDMIDIPVVVYKHENE